MSRRAKKEVPIQAFRANLAEHVGELESGQEPVLVLTKHGKPVAFVAATALLGALEEAVPLRTDAVTRLIHAHSRKVAAGKRACADW